MTSWELAETSLQEQGGRSYDTRAGQFGGYEFNRMVVQFSMMDGAREIQCAVSASAMDDIEHVSRTAPDQREQQFLRLRDRIEQRAVEKFVAGDFEGNPAGIILRGIDFRKIGD